MSLNRMTLCGLIAIGLAACPAKPLEITSSQAALDIAKDTDALAEAVAQSVGFVGETETAKSVNQTCITQPPAPDGTPGPTTCTGNAVDTAQPSRDAADWLKQHLFNADHVNPSLTTSTSAFFCLQAGDFCGGDGKCASALAADPVCVKAQSFEQGEYDLALLVGAEQQMNPFNLHLTAGSAKLEVKLADLKAAYEGFVQAAGASSPRGSPPA